MSCKDSIHSTTNHKQRCHVDTCKKSLGLMPFTCSCCKRGFCVRHRLPEEHKCEKDYKSDALFKHKQKVLCEAITDNHHYVNI